MIKFILVSLYLFCWRVSYAQETKKTMIRLPDTGVLSGYTGTFGEDNDYQINMPFFINNGNGTITDTITGLMWQQIDGGEMSIENARIYCDTLTLGNFTNWRLPNSQEAFSILNHQFANPALNTDYFTKTLAEYWWTNNKQYNDSTKYWATNSGGGIGNHSKFETISAGGSKKFHVRAVREISAPTILSNRFIENGNGTIIDNFTNLIWQKIPNNDTLTWEQALIFADSLNLAGHSEWRLPNIKELRSISDDNLGNPSINQTYFSIPSARKFWSSTTLPNQITKAWYLNTQFGITTYDAKTLKHQVICVSNFQNTTAIIERQGKSWGVFPNPFQSHIYINKAEENEKYELYNHLGQLIYEGSSISTQDFSYLPEGIYFLEIFNSSWQTHKIVKE